MQRRNKKIFYIVSAVLILVLLIGYAAYAATWTGGYKVPAASPSVEMFQRIKSSQKNGGNIEIADSEINSFIQNFVTKSISRGGMTLEGVGVNLDGDRMIIKAPVVYKGFNILVSCSTGMTLESNKLVLRPLRFKVGKLPLPSALVLKKAAEHKIEGVKINSNSIELDKDIIPFPVEALTIRESKLVMDIPSPEQLAKEEGITAQQSAGGKGAVTPAPSNNKTAKSTTNPGGKTTSKSNTEKAAADPKVEASLKKVSGGLSAVSSSVVTGDEKAIISRIQSTINKIIADPDYSYKGDVSYVKSKYQSLTPESRERVKSAIVNKMNISEIMKLIYIFGV